MGLDEVLDDMGISARELSPAAALENVVAHALEHRPRAVVLAGDLVDQDEDRFEACAILVHEVARLREENIPVLAVAGNHDGLVLPRLVERVPGVHLLGAQGVWERRELPGDGRPVDLLGWSFPKRHVRTSPLDHPSFQQALDGIRAGATALGVLHGHLDAASSLYAPISRRRLEQTPLAAWFLGHVHQPSDLSGARPIGYLGSLVGLDAGEPGPRGPWHVCPADGGGVRAEQLPLAPVRWESLEVELQDDNAVDEDTLHARIEQAVLERLGADATLDDERLRMVVARTRLTGRLTDRRPVRRFVEGHRPCDTVFHQERVPVIVAGLRDETRNAVDLAALAEEPSPLGQVASNLLELQQGRSAAVLEKARRIVDEVGAGGWGVDDEVHALPAVEQLLESAAWRVLDTLLDQRREVDGG